MEDAGGQADPAAALLGVRVLDPACGSGHFLLAAGRHIAARVARLRAGGTASADEYRHALRDVARACLHGVDRNPMAVGLAKVALWIETVEPGRPLGFLEANLRCGDALLGVADLDALRLGIPDAAFKPLAGDDRAVCRALAARNRAEREGQGALDAERGGGRLPPAAPLARDAAAWRALPEDSPADIATKRARFDAARAAPDAYALQVACDLYVAAFLQPKPAGAEATSRTSLVPTTAAVWTRATGGQVFGPLEGRAVDLARDARAFHWPLEFPDVWAAGGFDAVLGTRTPPGNPPPATGCPRGRCRPPCRRATATGAGCWAGATSAGRRMSGRWLPELSRSQDVAIRFFSRSRISRMRDLSPAFTLAGLRWLSTTRQGRRSAGFISSTMCSSSFPSSRPPPTPPPPCPSSSPRVLELTYTSHALAPFARDLGHEGPPFRWDENRRATLRAELDAWYARAYGLTRDELRYVLDPADTHGPAYPSETFRVLRENECRRFHEYRTRRLVLDAWDRLDDATR